MLPLLKKKVTINDRDLACLGAVILIDVSSNHLIIGNPAEDIQQIKRTEEENK